MIITGVLLYSAIPMRTTQSLWFRIKVILLIAAADQRLAVPASHAGGVHHGIAIRCRRGARASARALSLALWAGVIVTGRFIAYDWYDCGNRAIRRSSMGGWLHRGRQ